MLFYFKFLILFFYFYQNFEIRSFTNSNKIQIEKAKNLSIPSNINSIIVNKKVIIHLKENGSQTTTFEILKKILIPKKSDDTFLLPIKKYQKLLFINAYTLNNQKKFKANIQKTYPLSQFSSYKNMRNIKVTFSHIDKDSYIYLKYSLTTDIFPFNHTYGKFLDFKKKTQNEFILEQEYKFIVPKKKYIYFLSSIPYKKEKKKIPFYISLIIKIMKKQTYFSQPSNLGKISKKLYLLLF